MVFDDIQSRFDQLQEYMQHGAIVPHTTPEEIRRFLTSRYDFSKSMALDDVIADVERMLKEWQVQVTHPRYFGLFNPSVTLASVIADTLAAMYNPQLAAWRTSPAANEIERHTLAWLTAKFGLPPESIATFTSGGNEANLSAVTVALTRAFPDYGENGLRHLDKAPTIYLTAEAHHGYHKDAHIAGIGRNALRIVSTGSDLKLDLKDLKSQIEKDRSNGFAPFMVIGTAGTTAAGVIDPLSEIGQFCQESGLWFHVDAAWGGAGILSPSLKHHLAGIETADSITCDAHKWFSVPMGCGMFFCRHAESVAETFRGEPVYMPTKGSEPVFDPYTNSVQWSRRFIGLKLFMALAHHGEEGQVAMIEHQSRMGQLLREALKASGWRIVNDTPLPLVCFTRDGLDVAGFLASLRDRQIAWMSEVQLAGVRVVRACVTSYRTTEEDVRWVVGEMNRLVSHDAVALSASA
jgi:glutamate/tyrosine decarboxylase-like PLP-dependent enzyme